jgi:type I restriction enzyme R subunit
MAYEQTEQETRTRHIYPAICEAKWDRDRILEGRHIENYITKGRIIIRQGKAQRQQKTIKYTDYILELAPDFPIAVVEAKRWKEPAEKGLQQAKEYAQLLETPFAYATNGQKIIEFDFITGIERTISAYPTPTKLKNRLEQKRHLSKALLEPTYRVPERPLRYYQKIAVNRVVEAITAGQERILVCMATGTGKSTVAFQICWKLSQAYWNKTGKLNIKPRILYLADRDILVNQPYNKDFAPFGEARHRILSSETPSFSRQMFFAIYQAIAEDERREGLFKEYPPDFFDLIIVDECHRGAARDNSNWRKILEHFKGATQLGMTATPAKDEDKNSFEYFGEVIYTYSLKQAINDGYLAPYRLKRIVTRMDADGYHTEAGQLDKLGQLLPEQTFETPDFDKVLIHEKRTEAIAQHLTNYLKATNRFDKSIIFCVDQDHAYRMKQLLNLLNQDIVQFFPDYVCRITSDEDKVGKRLLSEFQDTESKTPILVTTSEMLTTGVDAPTVKNIAIVRSVGNMATFKQIIGRGTRLDESKNKLFFTVLDYTGWASAKFEDPEFNALPEIIEIEDLEDNKRSYISDDETHSEKVGTREARKRYVVEGVDEEAVIVTEIDAQLNENGSELQVSRYIDRTKNKLRTLYRDAFDLQSHWHEPSFRENFFAELKKEGIDLNEIIESQDYQAIDVLDLLCSLAWNRLRLTRKERAKATKKHHPDFFSQYGDTARTVLDKLLDQYTEYGVQELKYPDVLRVPAITELGNPKEIIQCFEDNPVVLKQALTELQVLIYAQ